MRGPPTKLTPEVAKTVLDRLRDGIHFEVVARIVKVNPKTLWRWRLAGKKAKEKQGTKTPHEKFLANFYDDSLAMFAEWEAEKVQNLNRFCDIDGKMTMEMLARRAAKRWSPIMFELRQLRKEQAEDRKTIGELKKLIITMLPANAATNSVNAETSPQKQPAGDSGTPGPIQAAPGDAVGPSGATGEGKPAMDTEPRPADGSVPQPGG